MNLLQALVLGIVQGLTEFLPVSSSGHLVLFPFVVGWEIPSVSFDVAVHFGTLVGLLWVLRNDVADLLSTLFSWSGATSTQRNLWRLLVIGSIPIAVFGIVAKATIEGSFERPVLVSLLLGVTGWFLLTVEGRFRGHDADLHRETADLENADAALVGVGQAAAVFPGISRSGTTIVTGMLRGLTREAATRFAFLLAIPAVLGATIFKIPDIAKGGGAGVGAILFGMVAAAVVGAWSVRWMIGFVSRRGLRPFGFYCFMAMTAGLLTALARG